MDEPIAVLTKRVMKEKGLTQVELAKILGVNQATVSRMYNGSRNTGYKRYLQLLEMLEDK